jgi:hypothetical protein
MPTLSAAGPSFDPMSTNPCVIGASSIRSPRWRRDRSPGDREPRPFFRE